MFGELVETWRAVRSRTNRPGEVHWTAVHDGHDFRVVVRGLRRVLFIVDGRRVDARSPLFALSRGVPLLSSRVSDDRHGTRIAEAYVGGPLARRVRLRVGGVAVPMIREAAIDRAG
jgi:hypothetical protein